MSCLGLARQLLVLQPLAIRPIERLDKAHAVRVLALVEAKDLFFDICL